ncbi:MAG: penicillin-binding protein activator LpoB [Leptospiraceae bacterium]|nr:penicillin-binding protein activator LpoB [Leptospiraceae bacterium]
MKNLILLTLSLWFSSCGTGASYLTEKEASSRLADSGGLTRVEMEKAAERIASKIAASFQNRPSTTGVFVAILRTKNDTSEQIPTEIFENALVKNLLLNKIFTIRTDKREDQLKEIKISQMLGTDLDLTNLKSPNYFVRSNISENVFRSSGDKIIEHTLTVELVEVGSLVVSISEKETFSKKAKSKSGVEW